MGFSSSVIKLRKDGLYRVTIRYSSFYFYTSEVSDSFKTLGEARDWLLKERCNGHEELVSDHKEEVEEVEEEQEQVIEGNAFENDSDSEEDTEQKRNIRLNKMVVLEELKKKPHVMSRRRRGKKWAIKFKN